MRRRTWIVAAGATAVAGAAYFTPRLVHRFQAGCGFPPAPPAAEKNVTVESRTFHSHVLDADVGVIRIAANPVGAAREEPLIIFALPGRDGSAIDHAAGLHLADYVGRAARLDGSRPVQMVVVDSGSSYWHARRGGEDRMRMLIQEIVTPAIARANLKRGSVALIGWSMGAYGAFLAAEKYPQLFGSVCGVSVAMWRSAAEQQSAVPDAFDDARDFELNDLRRRISDLRTTRIRLACGEGDPFFAADQEFAARMRTAGLRPQIAFSPGCHDDSFWRRSAPADFDFLLGA